MSICKRRRSVRRCLLLEQGRVRACELLELNWLRVYVSLMHGGEWQQEYVWRKGTDCLLKWAPVSHASPSTNTNSDPRSPVQQHTSALRMIFTDLPPEILLKIISLLEICDVARIRQVPPTSRQIHSLKLVLFRSRVNSSGT